MAIPPYGHDPYGTGRLPGFAPAVSGGYGGDPYGHGPYGTTETIPPRLSSAISLTPWTIEVFFNEEMDPADPLLVDSTSYTLTPIIPVGGPVAVVQSVAISTYGPMDPSIPDYVAGVLSVILTHRGATLGGYYSLVCVGPHDISGNPILPIPALLYTRGEPPAYTVLPQADGRTLLLDFDWPLLDDISVEDPTAYAFTPTTSYPITLSAVTAVHPYLGDASKVWLDTKGQTTLNYTAAISPAVAFNYDGSYLPSAATTFLGAAEGTGTSAIVSSSLRLTRTSGNTYGWHFYDTVSGKIAAGTTYRTDVTFDASVATYVPALGTFPALDLATITVENDHVGPGIQVLLTLQRAAGPTDKIRIQSGAFDQTVTVAWSIAPTKITVLHNILGDFYSILVNDLPVVSAVTADFTEASSGLHPGTTFLLLNGALDISGFKVSAVRFTASSTIYSAAWNFLHDWQSLFMGSGALTRDFILTERGPLVKNWGDMTPATKNDVVVRVAGTSVGISAVNPHLGKITLSVPVPLLPPGDPQGDVAADYYWLANPVMMLTGLNEHGQVLNKWDRNINGFHSNGVPTTAMGAPDQQRFPYCIVIGPMDTPEPIYIGHRYMGFEKEYSALLNSPTTLLLNVDPNSSQVPGFVQIPEGSTAAYEGTETPPLATPPWTLVGTDSGYPVSDGTYRLIDSQAGSFASPTPPSAFYKQDMDMGFPASMTLVCRYLINGSPTTDGIFTGVGFGFHQDKRLYLVGNLLINNVQHVGLLKDSRNPHLTESWDIGPTVTGTILTSSSISFVDNDSYPDSFVVGNRFQILAPQTQAGVYTATAVVLQSDGTVTVTVTPAFPVDFNKYGNKYPDVIFETIWLSSPTTYRVTLAHPTVTSTAWNLKLALAGETSVAEALNGDAFGTDLPQAAETSLALFTDQGNGDKEIGTVVWGSLSYAAKNDTSWSFIRYGIIPDATSYRGCSKSVSSTMAVLPEDEIDPAWYQTQAFGYSSVDAGYLTLKSTSGNVALDTAFAYGRDEPFFRKDSNLDLTTEFFVDTGVLGAGDCEIVLNDGTREARVATLLYYQSVTSDPYRQLVNMPNISFAGLIGITSQGWVTAQAGDGTGYAHENDLVFDQVVNTPARYMQNLDMTLLVPQDSGERVVEFQFAVDEDFVPGTGGKTGVFFSADMGATADLGVAVTVWMNGIVPTVSLALPTGLVSVQDYAFDWTDGLQHDYRVVGVAGVVSLTIDGTLQVPTKNAALFVGQGSGLNRCLFGTSTVTGAGQVRWRSGSYSVWPHTDVKRTLGVYLGGGKDDIDNWEIPRTDSSTAKNSDQTGPVIEEMDWRTEMTVRVLRTWDWGVTVYRPDLPLPPYYNATPPYYVNEFATQTTEPDAGWINVEYRKLPYVQRTMGFVGFGSFDSRSITQQKWDILYFRLFKPITDDWKAPQHMVLNQANVITSGEPVLDDTLETAAIMPLENLRQIALKPTHIYAKDVYKVVDGPTIYTRDTWTFDTDAQLLTLDDAANGDPVYFSGNAVTILYYPGKPYTNTYLQAQALLDSMTLLNEGTPPVPKGQQNSDVPTIYVDGEYRALEFSVAPRGYITVVNWATVVAGDTITVDEHALTAVAVVPGVNEFQIGASNAGTATNIAAALNLAANWWALNVSLRAQAHGAIVDLHSGNEVSLALTLTNPGCITTQSELEALYENMAFTETNDGGWEHLISTIGEGFLSPGFTGWEDTEGEIVYDSAGLPVGFVGNPIGGHVLWFKGSAYWNKMGDIEDDLQTFHMITTVPGPPANALTFFQECLGQYLFASGGSFLSNVVTGPYPGTVVGDKPAGGTLNSGLVLFPSKALKTS